MWGALATVGYRVGVAWSVVLAAVTLRKRRTGSGQRAGGPPGLPRLRMLPVALGLTTGANNLPVLAMFCLCLCLALLARAATSGVVGAWAGSLDRRTRTGS